MKKKSSAEYPVGAWYTYDDETCEYECMAIEYIYWGVATYLGYLNHTGIFESNNRNVWRKIF